MLRVSQLNHALGVEADFSGLNITPTVFVELPFATAQAGTSRTAGSTVFSTATDSRNWVAVEDVSEPTYVANQVDGTNRMKGQDYHSCSIDSSA
jgi:hypothetical protein